MVLDKDQKITTMNISTTRLDELLTRGDVACYSLETIGVSTTDGLGAVINKMKTYSLLFGHIGNVYINNTYQFAKDLYDGTGYVVGELMIFKPDTNNAIVFYVIRDDTNRDSIILYKFYSALRTNGAFDINWKRFTVTIHTPH